MPSFYRINVSLNGQFYFRADNEHISAQRATEMVRDFRKRFPKEEGFKVEMTRWECFGKNVEVR